MALIRPEARGALWRWREVLVGGGLAALGAYWLTGVGVLAWVGAAVMALGALLIAVGVQRGRFRRGGGGPGVVGLDEGQLTYFGPVTGGTLAVAEITRVEIDPAARPAPDWVLSTHDGRLAIPVNAEGAEALFDVFAKLPGLRTADMLDVLEHTPAVRRTLWQAPRLRLH